MYSSFLNIILGDTLKGMFSKVYPRVDQYKKKYLFFNYWIFLLFTTLYNNYYYAAILNFNKLNHRADYSPKYQMSETLQDYKGHWPEWLKGQRHFSLLAPKWSSVGWQQCVGSNPGRRTCLHGEKIVGQQTWLLVRAEQYKRGAVR